MPPKAWSTYPPSVYAREHRERRQDRIDEMRLLPRGPRVHVADRPRRCEYCDAPTLITIDGRELDDREAHRGELHRHCR